MFYPAHRRIAVWSSNAAEQAQPNARDICEMRVSRAGPHLLFLSHCVPNPPNKGEKIRAHHELSHLAREYRIHLACFARNETEMQDALALRERCASVYVELLPFRTTLLRAAGRFALGGCLTTSFYDSPRLRAYTKSLERLPLSASLVYSSVMAQYAPADIPLLLDMVDVDSEKWMEYGRMRRPGPVYSAEGRRLREVERRITAQASCTVVSTHQERDLVTREFSPERVITVENGVDFEFFDPARAYNIDGLRGRQFIVFVGAMSYYPNADAVQRFAKEVFGRLKRNNPRLEFVIVGPHPSSAVTGLARIDGVTVTGSVEDVRRYLVAARAVVAPLRIARGIQNKVLEGLAMGKAVLATGAVCHTFGAEWPNGVLRCDSPEEYQKALAMAGMDGVRHAAYARFNWASNIGRLGAELRRLTDIHKSRSSCHEHPVSP